MPDSWFPENRGVGPYIRARRELARMSLRELSRLSQVSNAYLSQVERGLHEPSVRVLRAVASAMSIPLDELMRADGVSVDHGTPPADGAVDLETAIHAEPRLTPSQKEALVAVYRSFLEDDGSAPARNGAPTPAGR